MMKSAFKPVDGILLLLVAAGLVATILLSRSLETRQTVMTAELEREELSLQGEKLKGFAFGFEGLLADWYWIRSLQYIGDKLQASKEEKIDLDNLTSLEPWLLYPLLDNATTLDPNFLAAYSYGANVLPAIDKQKAIQIAQKGIENNPDEWTLYHSLGFIYWKLGDYKSAADTYEKGSNIKGAPDWMKAMAARMNSDGGSRKTAREIYTQMFENASDSQTKQSAELRLMELDSLDELEMLSKTLEEFKQTKNRCAQNWSEIFDLLKTKELPNKREFQIDSNNNVVDPSNTPYLIEKSSCNAKIDTSKTGLPRS
jgi:tetratricopeptide (TPR) repeat protein